MKTRVVKRDLLKAVKNACLIAAKNSSDPIISNVHIQAFNGILNVTANNYDEKFREAFPAQTADPGSCCLSAHKLQAILTKAKSDEVEIECTPQNWVILTIGKIKTKLPGISPDIFPETVFKREDKTMFHLDAKQFKDIHDKTISFIGENESRKNLMGLNIVKLENSIRFMGADAYRIGEYQIDSQDETLLSNAYDYNLIFPKKSFSNAVKIFTSGNIAFFGRDEFTMRLVSSSDPDNPVEYESRIIQADYPNLDRLLEPRPYFAKVESQTLIDALEMLEVMVEKEKKAVLKMRIRETMLLESQKLEFGEGVVEVDCEYEGEEIPIGLNIFIFKELAKIFKKEDKININIEKPEAPVILTSDGIPGYKSVLMPVKILW